MSVQHKIYQPLRKIIFVYSQIEAALLKGVPSHNHPTNQNHNILQIEVGQPRAAVPDPPDYPVRTYITTHELLHFKSDDVIEKLPKDESFTYSWSEIKDYFVEVTPQQLAFLAGDRMNNSGTELDQQFIQACYRRDLPLMKKLYARIPE